jgi:hypothetical protein
MSKLLVSIVILTVSAAAAMAAERVELTKGEFRDGKQT